MSIVFLSVIAALWTGCSPSGGEEEKGATITVAPTSLSVAGEGGEVSVTVTSDRDWAIYSSEGWATCSPTGGEAGTHTVRVKVTGNPSYSDSRDGEIVVKSGSVRHAVPLTQAASSAPSGMFTPEGYTLLWNDEFDGGALQSGNWTVETGAGGWGNNELQNYTARPENVKVENGHLVITARKESYDGAPVTSGRLITKDKFHFLYGYVVASIRLPNTANGLWPAFWMMGNDFSSVGWPKCGETDILEMGNASGIENGTQDRFLNGACHWWSGNGYNPASHASHVTYPYSLQDGEFHTFTCVWDETSIKMYIDREENPTVAPYFSMTITDNMGGTNAFRKSNFLLFNMAVGGNFPGIHDIAGVTALTSGSARMEVDYVRVFQK
jgi:beta-glucanase (GH16 family)